MKYLFPLLLVTMAVFCNAAVLPSVSRSNLSIGYIQPGDRLLHSSYLYQPAILNAIQFRDFVYRGNYNTRISSVSATEVGGTQYANAWLLRGGVGYNNVTIRVQSSRGYGYYYAINVWGR